MTATAAYDVPARRPAHAGIQPAQVVVRLHPEPLRPRPVLDAALDHGAFTDVAGLTRAVHALVEALAPGMTAEVSVVGPAGPSGQPGQPEPSDLARWTMIDGADPALTSRAYPAGEQAPEVIGDEQIRLDRRSRTLLVDGDPASLTKREFELLAHLALHQGTALSRRELMTAVWHERYLPGDRTVDVHVRRVRVKLGPHADRLATLRGFGYRFDSV